MSQRQRNVKFDNRRLHLDLVGNFMQVRFANRILNHFVDAGVGLRLPSARTNEFHCLDGKPSLCPCGGVKNEYGSKPSFFFASPVAGLPSKNLRRFSLSSARHFEHGASARFASRPRRGFELTRFAMSASLTVHHLTDDATDRRQSQRLVSVICAVHLRTSVCLYYFAPLQEFIAAGRLSSERQCRTRQSLRMWAPAGSVPGPHKPRFPNFSKS